MIELLSGAYEPGPTVGVRDDVAHPRRVTRHLPCVWYAHGESHITLPDELIGQARAAGLNVSRLASAAVAEELDRLAKTAELDAYLAELEHTLGPPSDQEIADARAWADQIVGSANSDPRSGAA